MRQINRHRNLIYRQVSPHLHKAAVLLRKRSKATLTSILFWWRRHLCITWNWLKTCKMHPLLFLRWHINHRMALEATLKPKRMYYNTLLHHRSKHTMPQWARRIRTSLRSQTNCNPIKTCSILKHHFKVPQPASLSLQIISRSSISSHHPSSSPTRLLCLICTAPP